MWITCWLFFIWWNYNAEARKTCTRMVQAPPRQEFHKIAPCSASGMSVIARTNTTSYQRCAMFASLKRGLAYDFIKPDLKRNTPENCMVYECPEFDILHSIRREKGYNYYSLYANPLPTENTSCVRGVGMFRLSEERANYTDAVEICRKEGGELADVLDTFRTNGLKQLLSNMRRGRRIIRYAYVGMDDIENEGKFVTVTGKKLKCIEYRAWAPGEPRNRLKSEDCVVINDQGMWRVVDCRRKLPFICELLPRGPFPIKDPKVDEDGECKIDLSNRRLNREDASDDMNVYKNLLIFQWL